MNTLAEAHKRNVNLERLLLRPFPKSEINQLYSEGFSLVPLGGGDDGKAPLAKYRGRNRLPLKLIIQLMDKHGSQTYGLRLNKFVVVDCDTDNCATNEFVQKRFGSSNFQVRTPRGRHYYYKQRHPVMPSTIREKNIAIDIKSGCNQYVVGAGSIRPDGGTYEIEVGQICDLKNIPYFSDNQPKRIASTFQKVPVGQRYRDFLAPKAVEFCPLVNSEDELFEELRGAVDYYCTDPETITDSTIRGCAKWAWKKRLEGNLLGGQLSAAQIHYHEVAELLKHKSGSDGLALLYELHHYHAAQIGKRFAIATNAMAKSGFNKWSEWRIRKAKDILLKVGLLRQVKKGGGTAGVNLYQLARLPVPAKGESLSYILVAGHIMEGAAS